MTKQDPELYDDPEEGVGDESALGPVDLPEYDHSQFEIPDDYEWVEDEEDE